MKIKSVRIAGLVCGLGLLLATGAGAMTASATSVGDVIAYAYAVGLPESTIQQCINQYSGGTYTSEQCDQAIAALADWAAKRDQSIEDEINKGTTAPPTETTAAAGGNSDTTETAAAPVTTTTPSAKDFINMTLGEKVSYVNSLPEDQRKEFIQNMSNDERNSFLKQMDKTKQAEVIAEMMGVGKAFGLNFSVDTLSKDAIAISARDKDGNLVDVTTFGNTVEETGIPYTVPVLIGSGAILLAAGGIGAALFCCKRRSHR